jgi:hypothetical protein
MRTLSDAGVSTEDKFQVVVYSVYGAGMLARLRTSLPTIDRARLAWVADGFGADKYARDASALAALLDDVEQEAPADLDAALRACAAKGPFECFAFACLARHAGVGQDRTHEGVMKELPIAIAGDLRVQGPLVCTSENWLLVAGDVVADALITSADVIIGGDAVFRDGAIGLNNWTQSMWVQHAVKTPNLVTEDYAVAFSNGPEERALADDSVDELLAPGLVQQLRAWQSENGPDHAVQRLGDHLEEGGLLFRGAPPA